MILWLIIAIAWVAVLVAGVSLYRIATYADQKFRRMMARSTRTEDRAA